MISSEMNIGAVNLHMYISNVIKLYITTRIIHSSFFTDFSWQNQKFILKPIYINFNDKYYWKYNPRIIYLDNCQTACSKASDSVGSSGFQITTPTKQWLLEPLTVQDNWGKNTFQKTLLCFGLSVTTLWTNKTHQDHLKKII